jgi:hypothetical protein
LLQTSPEHPQRQIIERLLAKECDKLRKGIEVRPDPLQLEAEDAESSTLDDDSLVGEDMAQSVNDADPARTIGHRVYGSVMNVLTRIAGRPLKTQH